MRIVILANGACPSQQVVQRYLRPGDRLICADGGARHALALGVQPHIVIGDMDSLDESTQASLKAHGAQFHVYPAAKDETDLELALLLAAQSGADEIVVLGGFGGRLDQTIANVLLLTLPQLDRIPTRLADGEQEAFIIRSQAAIAGRPGDILSLIPLGGDAEGVTTDGLLYPLHEETLRFGPARGVSNMLIAPTARISLRRGMVLTVHMPAHHTDRQLADAGGCVSRQS